MTLNFWQGKRVFLTGHTGFKGSWMSMWLHHLGAKVYGYALAPSTSPSLFELLGLENLIESELGNINDDEKLLTSMSQAQPEILFHMAAQPLVRESYANPLETYKTNIMGTAQVLEAARKITSLKAIIVITTDKCYENKEQDWAYREEEPLGGYDPYSASKACAELVTASYRHAFFDIDQVGLATARAGNVIGGGDFSVDRLIPDFMRALEKNQMLLLRYPHAIRPWQHVLESLHGYLLLAEKLSTQPRAFSQAWNFGPDAQDVKTVAEVVDVLIQGFGRGAWQHNSRDYPHEAHYLKLNIAKAQAYLNWHPILKLDDALSMVVSWYQAFAEQQNMFAFTMEQIQTFSRRCND